MHAGAPHPTMAIRTTDVPMVPESASLRDASTALDRLTHSDFAIARTIVKSRLHPINMMTRRQDIILASQDLTSISLARRQKSGSSAFFHCATGVFTPGR